MSQNLSIYLPFGKPQEVAASPSPARTTVHVVNGPVPQMAAKCVVLTELLQGLGSDGRLAVLSVHASSVSWPVRSPDPRLPVAPL